AATASAAVRPRRSPHKLQMRLAQFHRRTFTRNLPTKPSHEIFTRKRNFAGMNKVTCVRGVGQRDEIGATPGDMDEGRPLSEAAPVARAPRAIFTLASTDAIGRTLAASRPGRSLNPPRSLG